MDTKNYKLVYSTDPEKNKKCPKCGELLIECVCQKEQVVIVEKIIAKLRVEKKGRGGKIVTIIDNLPYNEIFVMNLVSEMKKRFGCGGTYLLLENKCAIEIQGEKLDMVKNFLKEKKINYKG